MKEQKEQKEKKKRNQWFSLLNKLFKLSKFNQINTLTPMKFFSYFFLSNITTIYFLYYSCIAIISLINKDFDKVMGRREYQLPSKSLMDSQNITLITSLLLFFYSIIKIEKQQITLSYSHLSLLITYYISYSTWYILLKQLSHHLKDPTCQTYHNQYKSISSFSFTSTFIFLVSCRLLSSTDNTQITSKQITIDISSPQYPPSPFSIFTQSIGPFSSRFSRCCEKFLFGFHCSYHFIAYHLLILFAFSSIWTSNDMLENGNHTYRQIWFGVLLAYLFIFLQDLIEFYFRPFHKSTLLITIFYLLIYSSFSSKIFTFTHFIALMNVFFSLFLHYHLSHK